MNDFTVTEAKDMLIHEKAEFTDPVETRKFIYRQLTRNVAKGLLKRTDKSDGGNKKTIYAKTNLFFLVFFANTNNNSSSLIRCLLFATEL